MTLGNCVCVTEVSLQSSQIVLVVVESFETTNDYRVPRVTQSAKVVETHGGLTALEFGTVGVS